MSLEILPVADLIDFDDLYEKYFDKDFPKPTAKNVPEARIVVNNNQGIAAGFVKLFVEAIIATDQEASRVDRVAAIDLLMTDLLAWCKANGVEQIHVFPSSTRFASILKKHYGFKDCDVKPLVLQL